MKNKILLLLITSILGLSLISCNENTGGNGQNGYTVIWQNYDGEILEIDENVAYGTIPSYDGEEPLKVGDAQYSYIFSSWDQEIEKVTKNITYTAVYDISINTYKVTWQNEDGTILEIDDNVPYGDLPSYDGEIPTKLVIDENYFFTGWSPLVRHVKEDVVYIATFAKANNGETTGGQNVVFLANGNVQYGYYPQTHVNDDSLIDNLVSATTLANGWVNYNDEYYTKITAKVFNNESYLFDDGVSIIEGNEYWFKCEPIEWQILANNDGNYLLVSSKLLDVQQYYSNLEERVVDGNIITANNYEQSDIYQWLNEEFYNTAFAFNNSNIVDGVRLLSYDDYQNNSFGFESDVEAASNTRECKTTDYARAIGSWNNIKTDLGSDSLYNSAYWTCSPSVHYDYCAYVVTSGGYLSEYAVNGSTHCVRPSITVSL